MADEESNGGNPKEEAGPIKEQLAKAMREAAKEVLEPLAKQGSQAASKYAAEEIPKLAKDLVMPNVMKSMGINGDGDGNGIMGGLTGKVGDMMSGGGGITGLAGKAIKKLTPGKGGKKGANATGYGQGRRIMVQQVQYIPVNVKDVFRAWTESEWPEYMHRVNTLDRKMEEDSGQYTIGVKGFWFKKNFTAQIQEMEPFKYIVWSTTQGNIKNTGRVSFHGEGDDLTLMFLNLDLAPSGLREKWVRGFRYHKRGIRSDFHRFAAWVQMRKQDELDDMEGWLGTIEGGKITQSHEEYVEEHPEEQDRGEPKDEDQEEPEDQEAQEENQDDEEDDEEEGDEEESDEEDEQGDEEDEEEDEEDEKEDEEEDEEEEEPEPAPKRSSRTRAKKAQSQPRRRTRAQKSSQSRTRSRKS